MKTVNGIRKKLSKTRERCPNLNEGVYELIDFIGKIASPINLPVMGLINLVHTVVVDIYDGKKTSLCVEIPEKLLQYRWQIFILEKSIPYVIIATIDDKEFVNEFLKRFNKPF